ncbi:hypothetical protein [Zeaxanthinibacter enoshimensis]|uniref:Uncharacterized protein n=1 Tax=Zeaxanthinibacter enoshimensis TaxID=392009 RepID=A0A4R6TM24_9FLAO|nr:hypothetical protein [Zeaxanthinibacter enoshimensis]TDQ32542.1 hypothetical protein CLV82_0371 [Zeaxanthinibacter enoshimensis]
MERLNIKGKILTDTKALIDQSCKRGNATERDKCLHEVIIKKHYNATDVKIDYHRKRIAMDIVMDDGAYDPKEVNVKLPLLHANILFRNLREFLNSCIESDRNSLSFYAWLLRSHANKEVPLTMV